jgi:hypothetical protein
MFTIKDGVIVPQFNDSICLDYNEDNHSYSNVISMTDATTQKSFANLTDAKKESSDMKELLVVIEATHEGKTLNFTRYFGKNMENSAYTWTHPFEKPVLRHHNSYQDAIGRVKKAVFGDSQQHPGIKTIFLTMSITDPDSIQKFLDGRYKTVSIGGKAKELKCGICGADLLNDRFCGHWLGRTYSYKSKEDAEPEKITCYWDIGDMEYNEVSAVNKPADTKQGDPISMEEGDGTGSAMSTKDSDENTKKSLDDSTKELDEIDSFLDNEGASQSKVKETKETDDDTKDNNEKEREKSPSDSEDEEKKETIDSLKEKLNIIQNDMEILQSEKKTLEDSNKTLLEENKSLTKDLTDAKYDLDFRTKQNIKMLREFKKNLSSSIIALKESYKIATKEDSLDNLSSKTITELKDEINTLTSKIKDGKLKKDIVQVSSPGVVDNTNTQGTFTEGETSSNKKSKKTLIDFVDDIVN